jgi:hypothetical protein
MDMLCALRDLPPLEPALEQLKSAAVAVRRAMAYERRKVLVWVERTFGAGWADECAVAFGRQPIGCYIALKTGRLCGFCCMESTFRNFLGPVGVADGCSGSGIGRALVLSVLHDMRTCGYAYAVVGDAGEPGFFGRVAGAVEIPGSTPGSYPAKLT